MGDGQIFYPTVGDSTGVAYCYLTETAKAARQLAREYHQSPYAFLDLPADEIWRLYEATIQDHADKAGDEL